MQKNLLKPKSRAAIDWEGVRRQIEAANQNLASSEDLSPQALEQAWARRSAQIAQKAGTEQAGEIIRAAILSLEGELYGLDVQHIFDIRELERVTLVPRVPDWVLGVVNWRGRILSVIDLRRFLGLPSNFTEPKDQTTQRLVVVQAGEMEVGLRVDEVFRIEALPLSQIQTGAEEVRGLPPELVHGIFLHLEAGQMHGPGIVVLLNLPALLADPRLVIREDLL